MTIAPLTQTAQFPDFLMLVLDIVLDRQAQRIVDANITAQAKENPCGFERGET